MKTKHLSYLGEEYTIIRTKKFSVGYGSIGSKGLQIFRTRDGYLMGHFKTLSEFRKDRLQSKKLMRKH